MDCNSRKELCEDIAVRVMCWHVEPIPWAYDGTVQLWHDGDGTPLLTVHSWQPDDDEAQCMQVVARMLDMGFRLHLEQSRDICQVRFATDAHCGPEEKHAERRLAILLAAKAALRQ